MLCTVVTASKSREIGEGLTYEAGDLPVQAGSLVRAPFRGGVIEGVVTALAVQAPTGIAVRKLLAVLSPTPLLSAYQLQLAEWLAREYRCGFRQALQLFLPPLPWSAALPRPEHVYALAEKKPDIDISSLSRSPAQQRAVALLEERGRLTAEALSEAGVTPAVRKTLLTKGWFQEIELPSEAATLAPFKVVKEPVLSEVQQGVRDGILKETKPTLLFGVTGSGKTEVYASVAAETLRAGKQVLILVPEILLTEHLLERFASLVPPERLALIHSRITPAARRETWQRVLSGQARLIVGSRSALFAPAPELGLIVIDEEHEWTYKNEQTPRYHARETAEQLMKLAGGRVILGSATPSLESWHRAEQGRYALARLPTRYSEVALPKVRIVDLAQADFGETFPFTASLVEELRATIARGEQAILFLNRRGMASAVLCLHCRRRLVSANSGLPYTVHHDLRNVPYLLDHVTGLQAPMPSTCPSCGSVDLKPVGAGTQRIEAIMQKLLPKARLLRADRDTLKSPEDIRALLNAMTTGQADILIGTQSVVKGLDLPKVTLAAVLVADVGLSLPTFRAGERVFQLLTQLAGRSGRRQAGTVVIQTFRPDALEIRAAAEHDTELYIKEELAVRQALKYPPYTRMVRFLTSGPGCDTRAKALLQTVQSKLKATSMAGTASAAPTFYGNGQEWHVLLRLDDPLPFLNGLDLEHVSVDVDPVDCL